MDDYSLFNPNAGIDWGNIINRGIDVVGAWSSRSPYVSPDDPRYREQPRPIYQQPQPQPQPSRPPQNDGDGIKLSKETLMMFAGGVLIFMVASRRR